MNFSTRKEARFVAMVAAFLWLGSAGASPQDRKPNFLLLFVDNLGYGDLGCYGNTRVQTPHIDRLAAEGVRCTNFYIGSPSCSPSRGAILTGRHPERNGLNYQLNPTENVGGEGLPRSEKIIPQYLKPLGYVSGAFGKWNIGFAEGVRPTERGFDEFLGHMSGNIHYFKYLYHGANDLRRGTEPLDRRGTYSTDLFADAALDFMRRHKDRPWFVYLPFNAVHFVGRHNLEEGEPLQWQAPAPMLARYGASAAETDQQKRFYATLTALDEAVGRVLKGVDELGLREHTVVLFISDNGAFMLPDRGLEVQSNRPLREGGVTTYEGGVRVPALIRWPGRIPASSLSHAMLSSLDVLPLMLEAAGATAPSETLLDGRNPLPALTGGPSPHDALYWVWNQGRDQQWRALREGDWKLVRRSDSAPWELYDLKADPGESEDLASRNPETARRLAAKFEDWRRSVQSDPGRSPSARSER